MHELPFASASVTALLIGTVVVASIAGWVSAWLKRAWILNPYSVRTRFQVHRLLTAGWLHTDVTHLAFNMLTLWFFANDVLRTLGPTRFVALYVSAVVVAFVPSLLRHMHEPKYNTLGASGAVAAVLFSAVLLYPGLKLYLFFIPIPVPGALYAVLYLAYSAWQSYRARDGVNHDAHFYGAVYGAMLTYAFEPTKVEHTLRILTKSVGF